jgi:hypothetical protein
MRRIGSTAPASGKSASMAQPLAQPTVDLIVGPRPNAQSAWPTQSATSMTSMPAIKPQTTGGMPPAGRRSGLSAGPR